MAKKKYWRTGAYEMYRSLSKRAFVNALQRLVPALRAEDIQPGGAGVRAQAVTAEGALVDDFRIVQNRRRRPRPQRAVAGGHRIARDRPSHCDDRGRDVPDRDADVSKVRPRRKTPLLTGGLPTGLE